MCPRNLTSVRKNSHQQAIALRLCYREQAHGRAHVNFVLSPSAAVDQHVVKILDCEAVQTWLVYRVHHVQDVPDALLRSKAFERAGLQTSCSATLTW